MKTAEQYHAEQKRQAVKDQAELERTVKKIPTPEGFETEWRDNYQFQGDRVFVIKRADDVEFIFRPGGFGTTSFKVGDGWRTFDRRGVEDSFYWKPFSFEKGKKIDFKALFAEHLERIEKRRDYHKTAITVPDIKFTVSPERLVTLKTELNKRGYISFHPSGFGTGYNILKRSTRRYGVRRGSADLEKFFGISPLFIESLDCD